MKPDLSAAKSLMSSLLEQEKQELDGLSEDQKVRFHTGVNGTQMVETKLNAEARTIQQNTMKDLDKWLEDGGKAHDAEIKEMVDEQKSSANEMTKLVEQVSKNGFYDVAGERVHVLTKDKSALTKMFNELSSRMPLFSQISSAASPSSLVETEEETLTSSSLMMEEIEKTPEEALKM